jgi:hypothetical protein
MDIKNNEAPNLMAGSGEAARDASAIAWTDASVASFGETILQEAQRLVYGDRNKDYGHPLDDFSRTAEMATGLLRNKLKDGAQITAEDFGMLMILAKLSRQVNRPKRDNLVDAAGYAATIQMCIEERVIRRS